MTNHPFDLKGVDTGKIGNNKFVDYTVDQYIEDQNLSKRSKDAVLDSLNLNRDYLKRVPRTTTAGKIQDFLFKNQRDYYLPTSITERLAEADQVKTEKENFDPFGNLEKLKEYNLDLIKAQDEISRKGRAADVAMEMAAYRSQLPFITNQMKDLSTFKQRQLLDAERVKQSLPNAVQARLATADAGFATQAGAIAAQQDAATRMAGLGMQRQFGQNVVYTPPLLR